MLQSLGHVSLPDSIGYLETSFVTINGIFILLTCMPFSDAGLFGRVFIHLYTHFKIGVFLMKSLYSVCIHDGETVRQLALCYLIGVSA